MNINRHNYEVFFIDYFDGKLTAEQSAELMLFISLNPDIAEEFNSFEELTLPVSEIEFNDKNSLKNISQKTFLITDNTFETYCIAYIEDDLTQTDKISFEKYLISNPEKYKQYKIFTLTKLVPEKEIFFENKAGLKRFEIRRNYKRAIIASLSVAATITIIFFLYYLSSITMETQSRYAARDTNSNNVIIDTVLINKQKNQQIENKYQNQKNSKIEKLNIIHKNNLILAQNKIKIEKDTLLQKKINKNEQELTFDLINHIENKKIITLNVESPAHNTITINYALYKKPKKKDNPETIAQFFKNKLQKVINSDNADPNHKFGFVDVADALVRGVNKITGKKMKLQKTYDSKGDVETLAFYSENLQIYKGGKK